MDYLYVGLGLVILMFAGDALVRGAVNLALRLGIPALIVSLTVVAFGTSAPELVVAVGAVLDNAPGIALGNVVGSNTANVLLVLGLPALLFGLAAGREDCRRSFLQMLAASVLFIALAFAGPFRWWGGAIMLAMLGAIVAGQIAGALGHRRTNRAARLNGEAPPQDIPEGADPAMTGRRVALFLLAGLIGLPLGAQLLVRGAVNIATVWGVSETVIGLTLVAVGTSLPELATTGASAFRRQADVALGNVIGSNLFNLLGVVGLTALIAPIPVDPEFLRLDLWVMLIASLALAPFVFRNLAVGRVSGGLLTALYAAYVIVVLFLY